MNDVVDADFTPLLNGRIARCGTCADGPRVVSSTLLPGFEYRGPGSAFARERCVCGYFRNAHAVYDTFVEHHVAVRRARFPKSHALVCDDFVARGPAEFNEYFDGCGPSDAW